MNSPDKKLIDILCSFDYERGPIRPPSESRSLLIRVERNCPWNRCAFCPVYKTSRFSVRPLEDVLHEIEAISELLKCLQAAGVVPPENYSHFNEVFQEAPTHRLSEAARSVIAWGVHGAETVFLQDADPLVIKPEHLEKILIHIRERLPSVLRITAYSRSKTTCRLGADILRKLKRAGLNRIHTGLESGADNILQMMAKGATAKEHIRGGLAVKTAGIELSLYVMPGLGGKAHWKTHALESARVVSHIQPDFIRLRTLAIPPGIPLYDRLVEGSFQPMTEEEILREIRVFIEHLDVSSGRIESDHVLNLLGNLRGNLPEDIPKMLALIDAVFSLPETERRLFFLGRRLGVIHTLDDLDDPGRRNLVIAFVREIQREDLDVETALSELKTRFI